MPRSSTPSAPIISGPACKPRRVEIGLHIRMERGRSSGQAAVAGETQGDELQDFDSLVRLHRPRVFRFLLASVRNRETAENLTQDCFIRAYQARGQFRGASSIGTWFMQIAANLVRNHESSSRLKFWRRTLHSDADVAELGRSIPDGQQSPETLALVRERVQAIWNTAASLPARQRTVFLLRFVEDLDLLEIAEVTGMKEGTVKAHLFRALQSVRARLEGTK
jgi:RNA polymerase sigma-70 factor, ECF subfamily